MLIRLGLTAPTAPAPGVLEDLADLLGGADVSLTPRDEWWSAHLTADTTASIAVRARARARAAGFDAAVTTGDLLTTGPGLIVTDVDSTLIQDEVIELLADHAGTREEVAEVTERAMRGEMDFVTSLAFRVHTLAGVPAGALEEVAAAVELSPGAAALAEYCTAHDIPLGVVSGGFIEVVRPIVEPLGITRMRANQLEIVDGRLTGRTLGPVIDGTVKQSTLQQWSNELGVPPSRTVAVGDGANDLLMLEHAALGVAYCAKPVVAESADAAITHPRLDSLLGLLGL